jgi:hypothetical protein
LAGSEVHRGTPSGEDLPHNPDAFVCSKFLSIFQSWTSLADFPIARFSESAGAGPITLLVLA